MLETVYSEDALSVYEAELSIRLGRPEDDLCLSRGRFDASAAGSRGSSAKKKTIARRRPLVDDPGYDPSQRLQSHSACSVRNSQGVLGRVRRTEPRFEPPQIVPVPKPPRESKVKEVAEPVVDFC